MTIRANASFDGGNGYRVVRHPHGVVLDGPVPVGDLSALIKGWEAEGFTILDAGIAAALGVGFVITSPEGSTVWRAEVEAANARLDKQSRWLNGVDTGLSSLVIFRVLGDPAIVARARRSLFASGDCTPSDPSDFGRCHRLIEAMGWRDRMPEVAAKHPAWAALVGAWSELTALYVEELPTGEAPRLYGRMKELR